MIRFSSLRYSRLPLPGVLLGACSQLRRIVFSSFVVLAGCSSSTTAPASPSSTGGDTSSGGNGTVNGVPAEEFYSQFQFETTNTDVKGLGAIPTQSDGNNAFLVHLFLQKDGAFTLFYVEGKSPASASASKSSFAYDKKQGRKVKGSWSIEGSSLVVGPLACNGLSVDGSPQLLCEVTSAVVSAGAVSKSVSLAKEGWPSSPSDPEFADYR